MNGSETFIVIATKRLIKFLFLKLILLYTLFGFNSHQVDIAGWTDADGPLSILPLLDEDSDLEDEVEQYVDDDSDNDDDIQQSGARKKTKVLQKLTSIAFSRPL